MPDDVTLYTQPFCGPCRAVADYLDRRGIPHRVRDVMIDEEARETLEKLGVFSAPALVKGDRFVLGFDPEGIDRLLGLDGDVTAGD